MSRDSRVSVKRGRPTQYPRTDACKHRGREEHIRGVCYACSSSISGAKTKAKKLMNGSNTNPVISKPGRKKTNKQGNMAADINPKTVHNSQNILNQSLPINNEYNNKLDRDRLILGSPESTIFNFNISGTHYSISLKTLEAEPDSVLYKISMESLTGTISPDVILGPNNEFFFQRLPKNFEKLLEYLTAIGNPDEKFQKFLFKRDDIEVLYQEAKFYNFTVLMGIMELFVFEHDDDEPIKPPITSTTLPKQSPEEPKIKQQIIQKINPKNIELTVNIKNINNSDLDTEDESSDSSTSSC